MKEPRKTKIVATIGPKSNRYENLRDMARLGMNVARLNLSHGTHEWHRQVIKNVKTINAKTPYNVAILLDTKGPEIRTGDIKEEIKLVRGDKFIFTIKREAEYPQDTTEVSYDGFIDEVRIGDTILIDGGMLRFEVKEIHEFDIITTCIDGGILSSRRHLNILGKSAKIPSITDKDWDDINFGIEMGVDFIALSFVKKVEAIKTLKAYLKKNNVPIDVIAKIESIDALDTLEMIIKESDGVMVARGDLGSEIPVEEVPLVQERIVHFARYHRKPVIVATHLLESMIIHPTPTRAEIADISHAVLDEGDAIMLSGETASGNHPFKSLEVMARVSSHIEKKLRISKKITTPPSETPKEEIVLGASIIANNLEASAMVVITRSGNMASILSRCRPNPPIFAFTNTSHVRRKLNLYWGISPYRINFSKDPEKTIQRALTILREKHNISKNSKIVIVSDIKVDETFIETIQLRSM